ncbi:MAG: efflux RND transporter periplasmic adaptor subunit [Pseudomonadota bacterium]|nr:efflux RND transporter periplasmic adaptor subunit [Pseudomonadota bacterium]
MPARAIHASVAPLAALRVALLAALLGACTGTSADSVPTADVTRGTLAVVLGVPGELEAVKSENVSAPNIRGGLKITTLAEEGTRVKAGDLLVEFDPSDLMKEMEQAVSRLRIAQTKIAQKQAQQTVKFASARNDIVTAGLDKERAELRVTESETVPRVERESARLDVEESRLAVGRSEAALQSTELEAAAELELLRLEEAEAQAKVDQIERQLDKLVIRATGDGIVLLTEDWRGGTLSKSSVGDSVWPGNAIMELPDLAAMRVEAWVHEVDATQVAVGQRVNVVVDARPETPLQGTVERVSDLAVKRNEASEVKHLELTIALPPTDAALKPGMTVRAEIQVADVPDVLLVPRESVFYDGAEAVVYRSGLSGWKRVPVKLGRTNDSHVVVTEGLEAGDRVALVDPASLDGGTRAGGAAPMPTQASAPPAAAAVSPAP